MNKVCLMGRLTADPKLNQTANGTSFTAFTLAVPRPYKNAEGQRDADFISVMVWGKIAEIIAKSVKKGHRLGVDGVLRSRTYEKDGVKRYITEVVANQIDFVEPKAAAAEPHTFEEMGEELPF